MGYSRRKHRGRAATNKKIMTRKSASSQQAQILDLNKKINNVNKKIQGIRYKVIHTTRLALPITAATLVPYTFLPLNAISNMVQNFSAISESAGGKYNYSRDGRLHLRFSITAGRETEVTPMTIFIISAKNTKVATNIGIQQPAPLLQLQEGVDYENNLGGEGVFMNKKRFHIHKTWRETGLPIQTLGGTTPWNGQLNSIQRKFNMKNPLVVNNRTGIWNQTTGTNPMTDNSVNPNQRLYLVVFNNNVTTPSTFYTLNGLVLFTAYTSE